MNKLAKIARSYFWSILVWVSFAPLLAGQNKVQLLERGTSPPFWSLLLINGVWLLTAALLTPPLFAIVKRYPVVKHKGLWRIAAYGFGSVPFIVASVCLRWVLLPFWDSATQQFASRSLQGFIHSLYIFASLIWDYILILFAAHAYWYFKQAQEQELERAQLQQALAASELQALKSQLHPHFLFNTLQGIATLIGQEKTRPKGMILKLSALLRAALEHGSSDLISLNEELVFIEHYLDLEKMRLEERLEVRWDIATETRAMLVPQLILQPLVENAIVHGVSCCREGGWIEVASKRTEHALEIQIRNSIGGKPPGGLGLGLPNTKARLKVLYGDEAAFSFCAEDNGTANATLSLPAFAGQAQNGRKGDILQPAAVRSRT